jgi:hypothetical protein
LGDAVGDIDAAGFKHGHPLAINDMQGTHRQGWNRGNKDGYAIIPENSIPQVC